MSTDRNPWWVDTILLIVIVGIVLGLSAARAHWAYGDWKCGMPGVHCRKLVK